MITSIYDHYYWWSFRLVIPVITYLRIAYWKAEWQKLHEAAKDPRKKIWTRITTIDDRYYRWSLLLMLTAFDSLYFWLSLLLMITTIGDHYRGSDLPPCLHADAFHSPVSKPLHQRSQIKNEAPPKKPSEQSWKVFSFQCGPKEAMKKTLITIHWPPL